MQKNKRKAEVFRTVFEGALIPASLYAIFEKSLGWAVAVLGFAAWLGWMRYKKGADYSFLVGFLIFLSIISVGLVILYHVAPDMII